MQDDDDTLARACAAFRASLHAERAWKNVQPVLLATFEDVARLLAAQAQRIRLLERELRDARQSNLALVESWRAEARDVFVSKDDVTAELSELADWRKAAEAEAQELRRSQQATQAAATRELRALREEQQETLARVKQNARLHEAIDDASRELRGVEEKLSAQLTTTWRQELTAAIASRPVGDAVTNLLSRKLDAADAKKLLADKVGSARLDALANQLTGKMRAAQESVEATIAQQSQELAGVKTLAANTEQLKQNMSELLSVVEALQRDVGEMRVVTSQKLSVEDAAQLLESRSTLLGLESAVAHLESAFAEDFVRKREHASVAQQVATIRQQLRSEMLQARYIWKEGRPTARQTIAWSTQVVNTHADVFVWTQGADKVVLKIPGLYHLQAAFFTDSTPRVQVLINGELALVLLGGDDGDDDDADGSDGRATATAGNIVGLSIDAFMALPARAVVQIAYDIDERAQGFLNLRKL